MAEVGNTHTLPHAKSPEHIENPISWCEMVITSQDIHYASHEMTISNRECRITMYIYGMGQNGVRYKKPMASSEGFALVAMTASAGGEAPPLTLPKGREFILGMFKAFRQNSFPLGNAGMPPAAISTYMHTNNIPFMANTT